MSRRKSSKPPALSPTGSEPTAAITGNSATYAPATKSTKLIERVSPNPINVNLLILPFHQMRPLRHRIDEVLPVLILIVSIIFICKSVLYFVRPRELTGAWQIVKQPGKGNYGFNTELGTGFVIAGFSNKSSAIEQMKIARRHHRHPPKPQPKRDL